MRSGSTISMGLEIRVEGKDSLTMMGRSCCYSGTTSCLRKSLASLAVGKKSFYRKPLTP